ncbi:hypothetical protein BKA65DRAFT_406534 [Rhexocercosporidium sp. MPI-PUGE-AT-0058]|nr:hypothetical protein BKA65DRAFT_406534 [Rhexocercosporidium sp. MPI-PUGE-AT-0058]
MTFRSNSPNIGAPATAVLTGSALSGAMISLSTITIPVFLDTDTEPAHLLRHWARLYHYGHIYMPTLCVTTFALYVFTAIRHSSNRRQWRNYVIAGLLTITMVPFTWLVMVPTNDNLQALAETTALTVDLVQLRGIVVTWAWLHIARSTFPLVGAIVGLVAVLDEVRR